MAVTAITLSSFPFATSTRAVNNGFPTGDSFPDMPPEFSSVPSTVSSVFNSVLNNQQKGLSTGATVGVSIGAAVAGLVIIGLIIILWRRRQNPNRSKSGGSEEKAIIRNGRGSENASSMSPESESRQNEIDGDLVHEVQGAREPPKPYEADHTHTRSELDSGWRGWEAPAQVEADLSRTTIEQAQCGNVGRPR